MGSTGEPPESLSFVETALADAHEAFVTRNPKSLKAHRSGHDHLPGANTRSVIHAAPFPITWETGYDTWLTSADGQTYLDLVGEFSAGIYGHSHVEIVDAVKRSLLGGWNFGGNSFHEKRLAQVVCERFRPSGVALVRFTNSGTEANTTALGAAIAITGKNKILVFSGGYHGSTLVFPMTLMEGSTKAPMNLPHEFVFAPFNNIEETRRILGSTGSSHELAAVLVEPVQGSGGCRPATREFLHYLRDLSTQSGALLIIDEVMASRLGSHGCSETYGVQGDIITLGKYIGGGMTIGAFGGRRDIMERFDPASADALFHPGTFNNNVVSMNAGLAGLRLYDAQQVRRLNALGDRLKRGVQQILIDAEIYPEAIRDFDADLIETDSLESENSLRVGSDVIANGLPRMFITGRGSMLNVRFSGPEAQTWQALFYHEMLAKNINIATRGYTPLYMALTEVHIDKYVGAIRGFVAQYRTELLA